MARQDTTVSLHEEDILRLQQAAEKLEVSVNRIVVAVYAAMMSQREEIGVPEGTVKHQIPTGSYKRMHVYLTPAEYEQKIDMRRFYKMSASKVLALGIDLFLEDLVFHWYDSEQLNTIIVVDFLQKHDIIPNFEQKKTTYKVIWGQSPG